MRYLPRHLEAQLKRMSSQYKVVLILGGRQVGKSTLLEHLFPEAKVFVFDPIEDLYNARRDPDLFLNAYTPPLILDEVQYVPELLSAIKRRVDRQKKKGLYFLTGSQNLSVLKNVAESMAGRVGVLHLDPMTPFELLGLGEKVGWLPTYLENPFKLLENGSTLEQLHPFTRTLWRGALPASVELEDQDIPAFYRSYLLTYIDRDVRTLEDIQDLGDFDRFMGLISMLTAQELNMSQIGREVGISPPTARKWLNILSYTYQWIELHPYTEMNSKVGNLPRRCPEFEPALATSKQLNLKSLAMETGSKSAANRRRQKPIFEFISVYHNNAIKRLSSKKKGYFKDTGFVCYRQRVSSPDALAISPQLGAVFETWVISNIHQQFVHLGVPPNAYHWRTQAGAEVDLLLERDGKFYPIEIKCTSNPGRNDCRGIAAFRKTYPKLPIEAGLVIHAGTEAYPLDAHTLAIPWNYSKR